MNIVAIIQARMGSTRLPGKMLLPLAGRPLLWHVVDRVKRAKMVDMVVLAPPDTPEDRAMSQCIQTGDRVAVAFAAVPENDLVARYLSVASAFHADIIVRVPGDNPCVEPWYIDQAIHEYLTDSWVFYSNTTAPAYLADAEKSWKEQLPNVDGLGAEVFSLSRLKWVDRMAKTPELREHVHRAFDLCSRGVRILPVASLRLDVNTMAEYEFIKDIYDHCYPANPQFGITEILAYLATKEQPA